MEINGFKELQELVTNGFSDWKQYGEVSTKELDNLILFNYTNKAQYARRWNWFEVVSRGLILNKITGEIVALPFPKFFNWFENGRKNSSGLCEVTEKMDGSLGILYRHNGKYRISTRGSFSSDQAKWATKFLNDNFDLIDLPDNLTLLFEIIYPENRIVVDYGRKEDLVLIGMADRYIEEDFYMYPDVYLIAEQFGFSIPNYYEFGTITEILEAAEDIDYNNEGWVLRFRDGERFKIKGDDYVSVHRLISKASLKYVLNAVRFGKFDEYIKAIPDEFLDQIHLWKKEIDETVEYTMVTVEYLYKKAPKESKKEFAIWVQENHADFASYMFEKWNKKNILDLIYKLAFREKD